MSRRHPLSTARRLAVYALGAPLVALAACEPSAPRADGATDGPAASGPEAIAFVDASDALPAHAPSRFGFGNSADEARIALWDIDVRPDGAGLPEGSGSVEAGRAVFNTHCVACHGPTGTEGPNDRLVDAEQWDAYPTTRTVGNYWPYATTLYDYIRKAMPQATPGILSSDEVYAVIAYILYLNEIVPADAVMDARSLPAVRMPAREKFVVDDRVGGPGPVR